MAGRGPKKAPRKSASLSGRRSFGADGRKTPLDHAILYGWHPVSEALKNPARRFRVLIATENALRRLQEAGIELPVQPEIVRPDALDAKLTPDAVHQGLFAVTDALPSPGLHELALDKLVLVLDQITDPHNFGAIVRTAAAFKVSAIVTTARHSPEATGVLAKSASGGLEHVPISLVQNLARAMHELKERGFTLVGLAEEGEADLSEMKLSAPVAIVLGAEGKGLRQLTRETCDVLARIDLSGAIRSLNVSNAAALALYIADRAVRTAK